MAWLPRPVLHAALVVGLAAFLVPPLVFPLVEAFAEHSLEWTPDDFSRLGRLALHTLSLAGGTVLIALPLGTILALLLFRTVLPRRRLLIGLVVFAVFIPLPVVVSG